MSINAINWVLQHSEATGTDRLVLIALADYANDDGGGAWPSVEKIALKARAKKRATQYALRRLEENGHVEKSGQTPRGTTVYRVLMGGARSAPPGGATTCTGGVQPGAPGGVQPGAPKPSNSNHQENRQKQLPAPSAPSGGKSKAKDRGRRFVPDPSDPADAVVLELYELWIAETSQPDGAVLTNGRASQCRARMREQAEGVDREEALTVARARMVEGLEGWFASDWHRANQAFDWETFFRSRKKVEMFRGRNASQRATEESKPDYSPYAAAVENA